MYKPIALIAFILLLILAACNPKSNPDSRDGELNLTDAQLKELMKRQPPMPGQDNSGTNGDAALIKLELAYQEDSSQIENVYNLAYMYTARCISDSSYADCPKALQYLSRAITLQPGYRNGNAFYNRMLCLQHLGNYEKAIEDLNVFTNFHKDDKKPPVNFYYQKAVLWQQLGKTEEACLALKEAAKLDTMGLADLGLPCK